MIIVIFFSAARLKAEAEQIEHDAKLESQNMVSWSLQVKNTIKTLNLGIFMLG